VSEKSNEVPPPHDAIAVKVSDGRAPQPPAYVVMGVTTGRGRGILGIWAGDGGEGARLWPQVFTELKNRAVGRRLPRLL
jgi:transposase-like protein